MRHTPEALDYEGVFPAKRSRPGDSEPDQKTVFKERDFDGPARPQADSKTENTEKTDETPSFMEVEAGQWQAKRGHGLTFACLFVFSIILYFRPYELIP